MKKHSPTASMRKAQHSRSEYAPQAQQDSLMKFDPACGHTCPYPSHAEQWRSWHGTSFAWLYNPWTGDPRLPEDIGSDPTGLLIVPPNEAIQAESPPKSLKNGSLSHPSWIACHEVEWDTDEYRVVDSEGNTVAYIGSCATGSTTERHYIARLIQHLPEFVDFVGKTHSSRDFPPDLAILSQKLYDLCQERHDTSGVDEEKTP